MKNIAIIGSGNIGANLEPLAELSIQLAYGKGHGGEAGFTFSPVH